MNDFLMPGLIFGMVDNGVLILGEQGINKRLDEGEPQ